MLRRRGKQWDRKQFNPGKANPGAVILAAYLISKGSGAMMTATSSDGIAVAAKLSGL